MKEIRVQKAARDQLPQLETDVTVERGHDKVANRPEREPRQESLAGYGFQGEDGNVRADQQSCEWRH